MEPIGVMAMKKETTMDRNVNEAAFGAEYLDAVQEASYGCFGCGDPIYYQPPEPRRPLKDLPE